MSATHLRTPTSVSKAGARVHVPVQLHPKLGAAPPHLNYQNWEISAQKSKTGAVDDEEMVWQSPPKQEAEG